ncbi:MAG TPA: hypothetical protein ENK33_13265 [Desulfobacterales bacterium]|uniref:Uncharacterized protein n=1 Tax=hydrothermal vent metagenome TaxID=652676 RepID=A0A3B0WD83_9ZZZZ|nr:hypothetical protein [Desulfobacterales bacterium]
MKNFASLLIQKAIIRISRLTFVRQAIAEEADLSAFRERPSLMVITGVFLICFSFLIGWPAVAALGALAIHFGKPMIVVIGGPLTYGLSHLVFMLGMYISGGTYTVIFFRWLTRIVMERLLERWLPDTPVTDLL